MKNNEIPKIDLDLVSKNIHCTERQLKSEWSVEMSKYTCIEDGINNRMYWVNFETGEEYNYDPNVREEIESHTVVGNIFNCKENVICHQVNMHKKMGSGIAKQIREKYPNVYEDYLNHEPVLGEVCIIPVEHHDIIPYQNQNIGLWIANMYSQNNYGYDGKRYTDYDAMRKCFKDLNYHISKSNECGNNYSLAIPYNIGCGLGGGDWNFVSQIIVEELTDIEYTIYKLN